MGFKKSSRMNSKLLHYVFFIAMSFPQKHCAVKSNPGCHPAARESQDLNFYMYSIAVFILDLKGQKKHILSTKLLEVGSTYL